MKRHLFGILLLFSLVCLSSCTKKPDQVLSFAFIGDIHYKTPEYRSAGYLVESVSKEMAILNVKPEMIILSGDFFHGSKGTDIENESEFAFKNFSENFNIPFFIAKGNHDSREYFEKNAFPLFSRELGSNVNKTYFSFNKLNCHFIILDCTDETLKDQLSWLEKDLETAKASKGIDHIFVVGHYPLWIVARSGFTRSEYSTPVASLLARYKVDAYFCGHTHNKTMTVRLIHGQPLTQIMDAGVVEENRLFNLAPFMRNIVTTTGDILHPGILPLEEAHQIFIPKSELKYYWGYQEGSTTSYYTITVRGKNVQADWHVLGRGVIRSVRWNKPGMLEDLRSPAISESDPLKISDFREIEKAWLYAAPWTTEDSVAVPFQINGIPSGKLEMSRIKMASSPFWNKIEIPLNSQSIGAIKMENEITFTHRADRSFGMAHIFLLVKFRDGLFAKSNISQKVLISFTASQGVYPDFPEAELLESAPTGKPLPKVILRFDKYYLQRLTY